MEFCVNCDNMYYIKLTQEGGNSLVYYCRNCGNENSNFNEENLCVSSLNFSNTNDKYSSVINKYTKLDPTLPRISNIPCPNADCPTHRESDPLSPEVIYIRYNTENLNFVYLCTHCDTTWSSNKKTFN